MTTTCATCGQAANKTISGIVLEPAANWYKGNANFAPPGSWGGRIHLPGQNPNYIDLKADSGQQAALLLTKHLISKSYRGLTAQVVYTLLNTSYCDRAGSMCQSQDSSTRSTPIGPSVWGSAGWSVLALGVHLPEQEFRSLFNSITEMLNPLNDTGCQVCYEEATTHPLCRNIAEKDLSTVFLRAKFVYAFHDAVNQKLAKPRPPYKNVAPLYNWPLN